MKRMEMLFIGNVRIYILDMVDFYEVTAHMPDVTVIERSKNKGEAIAEALRRVNELYREHHKIPRRYRRKKR